MKWYDGVYEDRKAPCRAGRSFTLQHKEGSDTAVLLIHGYTGYPGELVRPAEDLYNLGFDIYAPRLPGHGTTGEDFAKTTRKDWVAVAVNAAKDLRSRYGTFYILGHSMGGAIAVIAAIQSGCDRLALAVFDTEGRAGDRDRVTALRVLLHNPHHHLNALIL